jgi:hypothetical protein
VGRLSLRKDGNTMYVDLDISSNAEALVALLLVCAIVVVFV